MSATKQERLMKIWNSLTPEERDYDRFVVRQIPQGASSAPETDGGREMLCEIQSRSADEASQGCSCHISAPCSFCVDGIHIEAETR